MSASTVLLLSDRVTSISAWREAFVQRGFGVIVTSAPATARKHWQSDAPLLTVVDLSLPIAEAVETCRQLRSISNAPILLILPAADGNDLINAYQAGVTECLIQPASPAVILLKALAWSMRRNWDIPEPISPALSWNQLTNVIA